MYHDYWHRWCCGWLRLLEGLVMILSLGRCWPYWSMRYINRKMLAYLLKREE